MGIQENLCPQQPQDIQEWFLVSQVCSCVLASDWNRVW